MSEDKSIDELINLAVSCGAGLYRNTCNAEVLTSFTQHELRMFYKAAQAAMHPEIDIKQQQNDLAVACIEREHAKVKNLEQQLAAANEKMLAQQAYRNQLLELLPELAYARDTHIAWRDCAQVHRDANPSIGDAKFHAELVEIYDKRIALIQCDDLSALQAHNEKYEARVAELVDILEEIRHYADGSDTDDSNRLVKKAAKALSADQSDCLATHDLEVKRKTLEEAADKFSNLPKIDEFKSYVYLKGYPKDIVEIELRRMAADLRKRHSKGE